MMDIFDPDNRPIVNDDSSEKSVERYEEQNFRVYTSRWYILLVYSFISFSQAFIWNMWGPIYYSMEKAFDWTPGQLALQPLAGCIVFVITVLPCAYFLERFGLRKSVILMCSTVLLGILLRCIPMKTNLAIWAIVDVSAIINGFPGAVTFYMPAVISSRWFAPSERKFATAVGSLLNSFGIAMSFILGPLLVPENHASVDDIKSAYYRYAYIQAGAVGFLFICVLIYYPDSPPTPPSPSADVGRIEYINAFKQLTLSWDFWCIALILGLTFGIYSVWTSVLDLILKQNGVSETTAGLAGFYATASGSVFGILVCWVADRTGHLKAYQLAAIVLLAETAVWMTLVGNGIVSFSLRSFTVALIINGCVGSALLPINFELSCEICFPIDESVVVGSTGAIANIFSVVFLSVLFDKSLGVTWMNYVFAGCCIAALPLGVVLRARYRRSNVDSQHKTLSNGNIESSNRY